jgi:hypothetical protein
MEDYLQTLHIQVNIIFEFVPEEYWETVDNAN